MHLDTTDPTALEALPTGTLARVRAGAEEFAVRRVPGSWYLPGDLVIASGDVADGRPDEVEVVGR